MVATIGRRGRRGRAVHAEDGRGWHLYENARQFPPFLCSACLSANTWTEPVRVTSGSETVGFVEGQRGCLDCWSRRLEPAG